MIRTWAHEYSERSRERRRQLMQEHFVLPQNATVLDLGGGDGSHVGTFALPGWRVVVADIRADDLALAQRSGYGTRILVPGEALPFEDGEFDAVFCNSVIEHVGGTAQGEAQRKQRGFVEIARREQARFAKEIMRVGKRYWVQTPNRSFPIESHTWLPFVGILPRRAQLAILKVSNRFWVKRTHPDWVLFNEAEFSMLFPGGKLLKERSLGMTKSLIVYH